MTMIQSGMRWTAKVKSLLPLRWELCSKKKKKTVLSPVFHCTISFATLVQCLFHCSHSFKAQLLWYCTSVTTFIHWLLLLTSFKSWMASLCNLLTFSCTFFVNNFFLSWHTCIYFLFIYWILIYIYFLIHLYCYFILEYWYICFLPHLYHFFLSFIILFTIAEWAAFLKMLHSISSVTPCFLPSSFLDIHLFCIFILHCLFFTNCCHFSFCHFNLCLSSHI